MNTPPWWQRLQTLDVRTRELEQLLAQPETIADRVAFQRYSKELADAMTLVGTFRVYVDLTEQVIEAEAMAASGDKEMAILAQEELTALTQQLIARQTQIESALLEHASGAYRRILVEIRAGTGGEEAALFAAELYRMYTKYAALLGLQMEPMSRSATELGGYREIVFALEGPKAYPRFKYESGVHRVQRVPETEAAGRIHTSAVSVAILPEPEEVELEVQTHDVKVEVCRASGPGGQSVNTTDSAVRLVHIPSGVVVQCQDERSQLRNKEKAFRVLRARLLQAKEEETRAKHAYARKVQVGSGDRSEKIRTYNFHDGRVTDHRIKVTLHQLETILGGDMGELIDALAAAEREAMLRADAA